MLGLAAGSTGMALARIEAGPRWLRAVAPLLVPAALLCLVILLGLARPQSLWVQGVLFAGTGLAWLVIRGQRAGAAVRGHAGAAGRLVTGAVAAGPRCPGRTARGDLGAGLRREP